LYGTLSNYKADATSRVLKLLGKITDKTQNMPDTYFTDTWNKSSTLLILNTVSRDTEGLFMKSYREPQIIHNPVMDNRWECIKNYYIH